MTNPQSETGLAPSSAGELPPGPRWRWVAVMVVASILTVAGVNNRLENQSTTTAKPLRILCAASLRAPLEEILSLRQPTGVTAEVQYGGSNTLLSQLQLEHVAPVDLFLPADEEYAQQAVELGLARDLRRIAAMQPVIVVARGNPLGIHSVAELLRPEVRISLADPRQAAIGRLLQSQLGVLPTADGSLWDGLERQVRAAGVFKPNVVDAANDLQLGAVDASIIWDTMLHQATYRDSLEAIAAPELARLQSSMAIVINRRAPQPVAAESLREFLCDAPASRDIWRKHGFRDLAMTRQPESETALPAHSGPAHSQAAHE